MADIDLNTLLKLIGTLNDSAEPGSASDRFRDYLSDNVTSAQDIRNYIESALSQSGDQYNKALQDLINHIGQLLGFKVAFGRYRGVSNQIGFDGLWQSPSSGWSIVSEVKTTDTYTIKTSTLLGYINSLVSDKIVKSTEKALGLYVFGRFDSDTNQLENAIIVENRRERLRVVSVQALISLLELKQDYGLDHDTILSLLLPFPVRVDPIVDLIRNVVSLEQGKEPVEVERISVIEDGDEEGIDQGEKTPQRVRRGGDSDLHSDHTGRKVVAVDFRGKRTEVKTWRQAFEAVIYTLVAQDKSRFNQLAPQLVGRKRPYISLDGGQLRQPAAIRGTALFMETNLSANQIVIISEALVELFGYDSHSLKFETE